MTRTKAHQVATLLGLAVLAGCGESGTGVELEHFSPDEQAELAILADPASLEAIEVDLVRNDVEAELGGTRVFEARTLNTASEGRLQAAREALRAGDLRAALEEGREARRLLARSVLATGGPHALLALIERIEELAVDTGDDDDDVFDDPAIVRTRLETLSDEARGRLASGDSLGAGERALLGDQVARHHRGRRHHRGDIAPERARLAVALAGTAVQLAERLGSAGDLPVRDIGSTEVTDHQNRWLMHAKRMLERAQQALAAGHFARAVHFAEHAHWAALKAVILPGGVTEEEIRAMVALAHHLYEEAKIAIGDDPTPLEKRLFERAGRLIELGEKMIEEGHKRGVAPVWRGAVISRWLMD